HTRLQGDWSSDVCSSDLKLLRVLDGVAYYRLGGSRKVAVNVRVLAATNRDLETEVQAGKFRRDLYHRLSQFQLQVPALRERPDEIGRASCRERGGVEWGG